MLEGPLASEFDAAYSLDVLEHIAREDEDRFISNIAASLNRTGVAIIGSPSLNSQQWASPTSKAGHINCKDAGELKRLLERRFDNVFMFSMNDEVVHTGFYAMAHYYFALVLRPASVVMKILIIGADGILGRALAQQFRGSGHEVISTTRRAGQATRRKAWLDLATDPDLWPDLPVADVAVICRSGRVDQGLRGRSHWERKDQCGCHDCARCKAHV